MNDFKTTTIDRNNNFDFLRILFSSLVIFSHSYPLTYTLFKKKEILSSVTNNQIDFGSLAVDSFFIISGYLVFISLKNSKTWVNYLWKRILRLFPGLIVLLLITIAIIPLFYSGNNIFLEKTYWTYVPSNLTLLRTQYEVNGVFENNPFPKSINGSLWSLPYEFSMYFFLLVLFRLRNDKILFAVILTSFCTAYILYVTKSTFLEEYLVKILLHSKEMYRLAAFFLAGSVLTFLNLKKIASYKTIVPIFLGILVSLYFNFFSIMAPILLPFLILLIALAGTKPFNNISKPIGDISYGIYIYGFFVQQIFMYYFDLGPLTLFIVSLLVTYILAYFSWHFVEKRALKYKNYIS